MADLSLAAAISPACSITDASAGCYTASWYLIWDQVHYWLLIQVPVIAVSIVYEWLELSSYRYVERLRKICDSPLTNVVNYLVQIITSIYGCINWIVRGGSLAVSFSSWSIESLFLIATGIGYGIRWLAAKNKVNFVMELHNLFDLLSVVAHFTISFQTTLVGNKYYRSWLDFGFLRSYVGYVVVDHLFTRYPNKTFFSQVLLVIFKALCLVFFFAAVLFSLEQLGELPHTNSFLLHVYECTSEDGSQTILRATSDGTTEYPTCDETWSFFSSIYFMFVTVSTVGYGDFSPHTVLGQLTVCVIIVFGIYTFANESAAFMTLYGDQRGTLVKYDGSRNTVHVIVTGNPSVPQTKDFIREFFHPDHEEAFQGDHDSDSEDDIEASRTVVGQSSPEASRSLRGIPMTNHARYGSIHEAYSAMEEGEVSGKKDNKPRSTKPLVSKWMHRGGSLIRETHVVILMRFDKAGTHASYQREIKEFVEQNTRYHKRVFLVYGSPLRDTDLKNAQLDRAMAVFFLPNKYSDDGNKEDAATVLRVLSVSQKKKEHTQLFAMLANSDNRTLLEATGLSKDNLLKDFGEVYHVHGSPQSHHVLAEAGIYTASSIVVLAQGNEAGYDDSKAIFNAILVNSALQHNRIFTIIELRDVHNNRFLDPVASFGSSRRIQGGNFVPDEFDIKSGLSSYRSVQSSAPRESIQRSRASILTQKQTWIQRKTSVVINALSAMQTFFLGSLKTAARQVSTYGGESENATGPTIESLYNGDDSDTFFQERFMNGALFPSYVADDLLIQSFFNPSLNMFIRKILDGKSCFVLYDVPKELRGRKLNYGELFEYMTSGVAHTLPIGLLRAKGEAGGAPFPYVYTCPSSDTVVYPGDKIFVLINVMALNRLADKLQRRFRNRGKVSATLADVVETLAKPPKAL
ncbi:hypothetical protein BBI17_000990 [Phytophthora kernoviae]|uniref:Uncharacterized protein n=2 Tax=Phytophthora kernoviae TaxID=325452 RepID=A0A3R7GA62_9STRA|nr:hypothetical protein G195_001577 [Phytophthora kernoviae 00238/432]RLN44399.1 hypothetical protein BBI17_000990 [Phytophthora kernoviae]